MGLWLRKNCFKHDFATPRRDAPESCMKLSPLGGRGECRVPAAPAASCAKCSVAHEVVATGPPEHPAFPHAVVLTVSFVLSPVTGLSCHRRQRIWLSRNPVGPTRLPRT